MILEPQSSQALLETGSSWPELLSEAAITADPGLAAAVSGGAVLSQPLQWCLVTLGGLVCATFSQQAFLPRPASTPAAAIVELTEFTEEERKSISVTGVPANLQAVPAKAITAKHQASLANWEVKPAAPQVAANIPSNSPPRSKALGNEPPAKLEVSSIKPARLQTSTELKRSESAAKNMANPCAPTPCQETSHGRLFRRGGR